MCVKYTKENSKEAVEFLLKLFDPIINNMYNMIITGRIYSKDYIYKLFIKSFANRRGLQLSESLNYMRSNVLPYMEKEDIMNEIILVMLDTFKRFGAIDRDEKPTFKSYILKTFAYNLAARFKKLIKKVNPNNTCFIYGDMISYIDSNKNIDEPIDVILSDTDIMDSSNTMFLDSKLCLLNRVERKILIMKYLDKMTDKEIGDELMMHRTTVLHKRHNALQKLGCYKEDIRTCKVCGDVLDIKQGPGRPPKYCKKCRKFKWRSVKLFDPDS